MKIIFACDHAGFELKEALKKHVLTAGYEVDDVGAFTYEPEDDYPEYVASAARRVAQAPSEVRAVVIGGSGQGEAIVANRFSGVRAVVYTGPLRDKQATDLDMLTLTREHNDANVLSLGARFLTPEEAKRDVVRWLETPFSGDDRHVRRITMIEDVSSA